MPHAKLWIHLQYPSFFELQAEGCANQLKYCQFCIATADMMFLVLSVTTVLQQVFPLTISIFQDAPLDG
jgi:hypothetical protein